jgi:fatty acid desaturase
MMEERGFVSTMLLTVGGLLIWAAHFGLIYAFNTLACTRSFAGTELAGFGAVPFIIVLLTLLALGGAGAVLATAWSGGGFGRPPQDGTATADFLRYMTVAIAIISFVAILWNGIPALAVPACG